MKMVALLRGINVGGNRKIPMSQLCSVAMEAGLKEVQHYIQSGNLVFDAEDKKAEQVVALLEKGIEKSFGFQVDVVVRTKTQWKKYSSGSPFPKAEKERPNLLLLGLSKRPCNKDGVSKLVERATQGEKVSLVGDAIWVDFAESVGLSKLSPAVFDRAAGSTVTMRNWNTVLKLDEMLESKLKPSENEGGRYQSVLDYWFGSPQDVKPYFEKRQRLWFGGGTKVDDYIRKHFEGDVTQAAKGKLKNWEKAPESCAALIVLLDQFSLNLYREQAKSYEQSEMAIPIALRAIKRGFDKKVSLPLRIFYYMPFMHSEALKYQNMCVKAFTSLAREVPKSLQESIDGFRHYAVIHRDIVKKFGRFPGRNEAFGRVSSTLELKYLEEGGYF